MTTKPKVTHKRERGKKFLSYLHGSILSRTSESSSELPIDPNEVEVPPRDNLGRAMSVPLLSLETKRKISEKQLSHLNQSLSKYDMNLGSDSEDDLDSISSSNEPNYIDLSSVQDLAFRKSIRITKAILNKSKLEIQEFSDSIKFPQFEEEIVPQPQDINGSDDVTMSEETTQLVRRRIRNSVLLSPQSKIPPLPRGASQRDRNRVKIIQKIVNTETDYIRCLRKILQLRDTIYGNLSSYGLSEESANKIFAFLPDILDCHEMFYMTISGKVLQTPLDFDIRDLQIGLDCISTFSKEIVAISYSKYSAQFTSVIDIISQHSFSNLNFSKCLEQFETESKETLKSALIKPIQIFPKYIHMISELLRHTEASHPDYCSLSRALTGLESLAIRLGVVRREAELKEQFLQLQSRIVSMSKEFFRSLSRKLLRIEPVVKLSRHNGTLTPKFRFLFIFNDHILCLRGVKKEFKMEMLSPDPDDDSSLLSKYFIEWSIPIEYVEVKVREKADNVRTYREVTKLLNEERSQKNRDLDILREVDMLVTQLYGYYPNMSKAIVQNYIAQLSKELNTGEIYTSLRSAHAIELELSQGKRNKRYIFYLGTMETLKEFVLTLRYAKLRTQPENTQGWLTFAVDSDHKLKSIQNFPIVTDTQVYNTMYANCSVNCATIVAEDFLWVCSGNLRLGIIMILSFGGKYVDKISQTKACAKRISVIEYMPPFKHNNNNTQWMYPTVWMGTESGILYIYDVTDPKIVDLNVETQCEDAIVSMVTHDGRMFIGLANGMLMVFDTDAYGEWDGVCRFKRKISEHSIISIHLIDYQLWCFTGNNAILFSLSGLEIEEVVSINNEPNQHVVLTARYGRAIWLCLKQEPELLLFHVKHKEVLQTISLNRFFRQLRIEGLIDNDTVRISSLLVTHGLLWVGTSEGIILNYELHDGIPVFVGQTSMSRDTHNEGVKQFLSMRRNIGQRRAPSYPTTKRASLQELQDGYWTQDHSFNPTTVSSSFEVSNIVMDGSLRLTRVSSDPVAKEDCLPFDFTSPLNSYKSKPLSQATSLPMTVDEPSMYDNAFKPTQETIHEQSFEDSATYEPIPAHLNKLPDRQNSLLSESSVEEPGPKIIHAIPPPKPPRRPESICHNQHLDTDQRKSKIRIDSSSDVEILPRQISNEYGQSSLDESTSPTVAQTGTGTNPTVAQTGTGTNHTVAQTGTGTNPTVAKTGTGTNPTVAQTETETETKSKEALKPVHYVKATFMKPLKKPKQEPLNAIPEPKVLDLLDPANREKIWDLVDEVQIDQSDSNRDPYMVMTSPKTEPIGSIPTKPRSTTDYNIISKYRESVVQASMFDDYSSVTRDLSISCDMEQVPELKPPTKNEYFVLSSKENNSVSSYSKLSTSDCPPHRKISDSMAYNSLVQARRENSERESGLYTKLKSLESGDDLPPYEKLILDKEGRPITMSPSKKMSLKRVSSDSGAVGSSKEKLEEKESACMDVFLETYYVISVGNGYYDWREGVMKPTQDGNDSPTVLVWELPFVYNV